MPEVKKRPKCLKQSRVVAIRKQIVLYGKVVEHLRHRHDNTVYPAARIILEDDSYACARELIAKANRSKKDLVKHQKKEVILVFENTKTRRTCWRVGERVYFSFIFDRPNQLKIFFNTTEMHWRAEQTTENTV